MNLRDTRLEFKHWTETEIHRLRTLAAQGLPAKVVATRLGRTASALSIKARELNIRFKRIPNFGDFDP